MRTRPPLPITKASAPTGMEWSDDPTDEAPGGAVPIHESVKWFAREHYPLAAWTLQAEHSERAQEIYARECSDEERNRALWELDRQFEIVCEFEGRSAAEEWARSYPLPVGRESLANWRDMRRQHRSLYDSPEHFFRARAGDPAAETRYWEAVRADVDALRRGELPPMYPECELPPPILPSKPGAWVGLAGRYRTAGTDLWLLGLIDDLPDKPGEIGFVECAFLLEGEVNERVVRRAAALRRWYDERVLHLAIPGPRQDTGLFPTRVSVLDYVRAEVCAVRTTGEYPSQDCVLKSLHCDKRTLQRAVACHFGCWRDVLAALSAEPSPPHE